MSDAGPRFELTPWRKPLLADDGLVVPIGGPALIVALAVGLLGHNLMRWSHVTAWIAAAGLLAAVVVPAWLVGHARHGPGSIRFEGSEMLVDWGRGRPTSVPLAAIQSIVVMRPQQPERSELVLTIAGRWLGVKIRTARVADFPEFLRELRVQIGLHGNLAAVDRASRDFAQQMVWIAAGVGLISIIGVIVRVCT